MGTVRSDANKSAAVANIREQSIPRDLKDIKRAVGTASDIDDIREARVRDHRGPAAEAGLQPGDVLTKLDAGWRRLVTEIGVEAPSGVTASMSPSRTNNRLAAPAAAASTSADRAAGSRCASATGPLMSSRKSAPPVGVGTVIAIIR